MNEEATPFDDDARVVVRARAGEVLAEVERLSCGASHDGATRPRDPAADGRVPESRPAAWYDCGMATKSDTTDAI